MFLDFYSLIDLVVNDNCCCEEALLSVVEAVVEEMKIWI